mgnify:CR=1 FL=1
MVSWEFLTFLWGLEDSLTKSTYGNEVEPYYFENIDYFNKKNNTHIDWVLIIDVWEAIPSLKGIFFNG